MSEAVTSAGIHLLDAEPPVSPDVIERLTEICDAVQRDEISSVGIAVVYRDGSTGAAWSTAPSYGLLIAAASQLLHRLLKIGDE